VERISLKRIKVTSKQTVNSHLSKTNPTRRPPIDASLSGFKGAIIPRAPKGVANNGVPSLSLHHRSLCQVFRRRGVHIICIVVAQNRRVNYLEALCEFVARRARYDASYLGDIAIVHFES